MMMSAVRASAFAIKARVHTAPFGVRLAMLSSSVLQPPSSPTPVFGLFLKEQRAHIAAQLPEGTNGKDVFRAVAGAWQDCTEEEKEPYRATHRELKEAYAAACQEFVDNGGDPEALKRKRTTKGERDPTQPKKPSSAWALFLRQAFHECDGTVPAPEVMVHTSKRWKSMDDNARLPFTEASSEAAAEYEQAMEAWFAKQAAEGEEEEEEEEVVEGEEEEEEEVVEGEEEEEEEVVEGEEEEEEEEVVVIKTKKVSPKKANAVKKTNKVVKKTSPKKADPVKKTNKVVKKASPKKADAVKKTDKTNKVVKKASSKKADAVKKTDKTNKVVKKVSSKKADPVKKTDNTNKAALTAAATAATAMAVAAEVDTEGVEVIDESEYDPAIHGDDVEFIEE